MHFQFTHVPVLNDRKLPPKHHKLPQFQLFLAFFLWNEDVRCLEKLEDLHCEIGPKTVLSLSSISHILFLFLPSILISSGLFLIKLLYLLLCLWLYVLSCNYVIFYIILSIWHIFLVIFLENPLLGFDNYIRL